MIDREPLLNLNASDLSHPLRGFMRAELYDELSALEDMLFETRKGPAREPDFDAEELYDFMTDFLDQIPENETEIARVDLHVPPASRGARALHWRIGQALSVVGNRLPQDILGPSAPNILPSHEVLLPMRLRARLELVLGCETIPMVWVRKIDLAGRTPLKVRPERPD
ncbi:hypothetical protein [uncultured Roseovarius sp.]|uniref:hypothetical protein n=1 Tax=uncultured Roseovarius sp. TaxID=293344 RepID=UPI0026048FD5|nr:hypothetical protein [uncultured Roseovarius sp.]